MTASTARVPTTNGSRYLQQLCKHWAHKMPVEFTPEVGTVNFPTGAVATMTAEPEHLRVEVSVPADGDLGRMQQVVADHLDRFAFREAPLAFDWQRS
ncbi:DUF2218 domain-containing protein [Sphingomonas cavernae]|uniref:DUF2218 domain-containing protein n=1 Tax=Sphingomonas cavernae TaxID=2320861 RepID=A0A418W720_9SPHN|nr:DUF2218 domain-containing protein [Sphingomonas cavernae]RJF85831.1 DUF2218 domain-containing protein [Sphingomonas cavernae]